MLYVNYLTYAGGMTNAESDAAVLNQVSRRESHQMFVEAHALGMQSFSASTLDERLAQFDKAHKREERAIRKLEEAITLRMLALDLRTKSVAKSVIANNEAEVTRA